MHKGKTCQKSIAIQYKQNQSPEVFRVFHVDGNLNNARMSNLKTVCCNCAQILGKEGVTWRQGDLVADN